MKSQRWLWSSVVLAGMAVTLSAQAPKPTFDVASVRGNLSGPSLPTLNVRAGGSFIATYQPLVRSWRLLTALMISG
jgi:hypothetical protein